MRTSHDRRQQAVERVRLDVAALIAAGARPLDACDAVAAFYGASPAAVAAAHMTSRSTTTTTGASDDPA